MWLPNNSTNRSDRLWLLITALMDQVQCGHPITAQMDWFGPLITTLTDRAQCGLPDNRSGPMRLPDNSTNGLVWPADNSAYRLDPMWLARQQIGSDVAT